jgi:predicted Zn-dependent peptidase
LSTFNKTVLPEGITIVSESVPYLNSFSLGFWFNTGSRDESKHNNGICHFIEHMLFKGTKKRSTKRIADDIEAYGGYLNAFTSKEHTCFYGRGLANQLERTFDVLADMIQYPAFKPSDIKKEAGVVVDELQDIEDTPEELIFDKFEEIIYDGNPLGLPIIGTEKNIRGFDQQDLCDFVGEHYRFNNLYIAACGGIEHEELVRLAVKYIKKELGRGQVRRKKITAKVAGDVVITKDIQQVHTIIGKAAYGFNHPKRAAANLLSHILGEGSSSILNQVVREKNGITYQINTFLNSFLDTSAFGVYFSTSDKTVEKAESLIRREFEKIKSKPVSLKELNRAKEYLKGNMLLGLEGATDRMFRIAQSEIYFKKIKPISESVAEIDSVTSDDVLEMANELLDDSSLSKLVIKS